MTEGKYGRVKNVLNVSRQEIAVRRHGGVRVNDVFWYHVSKEYPGQIGIHIFATDLGKTLGEAKRFLNKYKEGLDALVHRLDADQTLAGITHVVGGSKLLYEHPDFATQLGFEITKRDELKKEALAVMARQKFLTRPWRPVKTEAPPSEGRDDSGQKN